MCYIDKIINTLIYVHRNSQIQLVIILVKASTYKEVKLNNLSYVVARTELEAFMDRFSYLTPVCAPQGHLTYCN